MKWIFTRLIQRNSVFALGFGLPLFFFGSTSIQSALVIAVAVLFVVPATHAISYHVEPWFGKNQRFVILLMISAMHVTIFETILQLFIPIVSFRLSLFIRVVMVDSLVFWPFFVAPRNELFRDRMETALSLSSGFVLALGVFTLVRHLIGAAGSNIAMGTAAGFLLLGYAQAGYQLLFVQKKRNEGGSS